MTFWISFLGVIFFTNFAVCWCLCNLCREVNVSTDQSSYYRFTAPKIFLTADRAVNGKFLEHKAGDCAGTNIDDTNKLAWWNISLPDLAYIYKINLMFREGYCRHNGYYVFINKVVANVNELTSLSPVYYEGNSHPSAQNIIMFPGGISGKQLYIYKNTSGPSQNDNAILDICEIEIWGCLNQSKKQNCTCSFGDHYAGLPSEILSSEVAWHKNEDRVTMTCHRGIVKYKNENKLESRFHLKHPSNPISFDCSDACAETAYNAKSTYVQHIRPIIMSVGDKVTLVCKNGHRLVAGNLIRVCQKNGSWSGEEPICKPCTVAMFNASTTDAQYFQPNDTLNVGDNVTYSCKNGHRLAAGNLTRLCQENGSWTGEEPICKPCTMAIFNASTTDAHYVKPNDILNVGDNVTYTCKTGHRLAAGNLTRICQENGSWTGEEPYCKRCKCSCKRLASQKFIKDPIVLQERIEETKKILEVNRSELSAYKRKKISSHDGRASSTRIGMTLGVGVITFVIGAIVCSDLLMCKKRNQRKMFCKTL